MMHGPYPRRAQWRGRRSSSRRRSPSTLPCAPHLALARQPPSDRDGSYPGYAHRRTIGHDARISTDNNEDISGGAKTYVFRHRRAELQGPKGAPPAASAKGGVSRGPKSKRRFAKADPEPPAGKKKKKRVGKLERNGGKGRG